MLFASDLAIAISNLGKRIIPADESYTEDINCVKLKVEKGFKAVKSNDIKPKSFTLSSDRFVNKQEKPKCFSRKLVMAFFPSHLLKFQTQMTQHARSDNPYAIA